MKKKKYYFDRIDWPAVIILYVVLLFLSLLSIANKIDGAEMIILLIIGFTLRLYMLITEEELVTKKDIHKENREIVELQEKTSNNKLIDIDYINKFVFFYGKDDLENIISYRIESNDIREIYDLDDKKNPYVEFNTIYANYDSTNLYSDYVIIHFNNYNRRRVG